MSKGIIYLMTPNLPGLKGNVIKIGKTTNFESRMSQIERDGYNNITGWQRMFGIEVDDYDEKEVLLHDIFAKSRIGTSEAFALDLDLVIQLLSSFEGKIIYPENQLKQEIFEDAVKERGEKKYIEVIPNGKYYLRRKTKGFQCEAVMKVEDGVLTVLKGSKCAPDDPAFQKILSVRTDAKIENNILMEDIVCDSPSAAGWVVMGKNNNGWMEWKNEKQEPLDKYRK